MRDTGPSADTAEREPLPGSIKMVTSYMVQVRDCYTVDAARIEQAGGHLLGISPVEDDGMVVVDVDIAAGDHDASVRLSEIFSQYRHN